ncbi:unnamed protein product, partial [Ranitomeya imitator]
MHNKEALEEKMGCMVWSSRQKKAITAQMPQSISPTIRKTAQRQASKLLEQDICGKMAIDIFQYSSVQKCDLLVMVPPWENIIVKEKYPGDYAAIFAQLYFQRMKSIVQLFQKILNKCSFDIILLTIEYLQEAIKTTEEKNREHRDAVKLHLEQHRIHYVKRPKRTPTRRSRKKGRGSSHDTQISELKVLNMGLSFCPTPKWDSFQLERDLQQFYRNIRLKVYFEESTNSFRPVSTPAQTEGSILTIDQLGLRNRSTFIPPKSSHAVETFVNLLDRDVKKTLHDQRLGFLPVRHNLDSLEKQALDSLSENKNIVIKPADKGGGAIVVMDRSFYMTEVRRQLSDTSTYKMLQTDPTYAIQQKISRVLDKHLQMNTIDKKTKMYLTNNHPVTPVMYILPKIHKNLQNPPGRPIVASTDSILNPLSMFLEKLLTPHTKLTKSFILDTGDFLKKIRNVDIIPHNSILCTFMKIKLGEDCSVVPWVFFLDDDILPRWHHDKEVTFLDTRVLKDINGHLSTDIYMKPTDCNSLLLYNSCHPKSIKNSLPRSQFKRVTRIVSDPPTRETRIQEMAQKFEARNYPTNLLEIESSRAISDLNDGTTRRWMTSSFSGRLCQRKAMRCCGRVRGE